MYVLSRSQLSPTSGIPGIDSSPMQVEWDAIIPGPTVSIPSNSQFISVQPEFQSDATLSPAVKQNKVRKYTKKDWDAHELEITTMYKNCTLESVIQFMREHHGLDAT